MFAGQQQKYWISVPTHMTYRPKIISSISITKSLDRQLKVHALGRLQEGRHAGLFFLQEILNEKHTIKFVWFTTLNSILAIIHIQACRLICGEPVWSLSLCSGRTNTLRTATFVTHYYHYKVRGILKCYHGKHQHPNRILEGSVD